jgi:hypothetical protein
MADLAKEMDSTHEDNYDLLRKKTEVFYKALKLLDEVIDFSFYFCRLFTIGSTLH